MRVARNVFVVEITSYLQQYLSEVIDSTVGVQEHRLSHYLEIVFLCVDKLGHPDIHNVIGNVDSRVFENAWYFRIIGIGKSRITPCSVLVQLHFQVHLLFIDL